MEYLKIDINISILILYVLKYIKYKFSIISSRSFHARDVSKRDRFVLTRRLKARCKCRN